MLVCLPMNAGKLFLDPFVRIIVIPVETDDHTVGLRIAGKSVGLVCIHMHGQAEIPVDTYHYIGVDDGAAVAFGENENFVVVMDILDNGLIGGHMNMSFGNDDSFFDFQLALGTDQGTSGSALNISGLADDTGNSKLACVGEGKLHLGL